MIPGSPPGLSNIKKNHCLNIICDAVTRQIYMYYVFKHFSFYFKCFDFSEDFKGIFNFLLGESLMASQPF